jgi:hypothetical protein
MWAVFILTVVIIVVRIRKIGKTSYRLNNGDAFHKLVTKTLHEFGINLVLDLKNIFNTLPEKINVSQLGLIRTDDLLLRKNQIEREAKSLKSFKKWFDISPMRVTFKAEVSINSASGC